MKCQRCKDTGKFILETAGGDEVLMDCEHAWCQWQVDEDGVWDTACDNRHLFIEGGPKDNHYHFCPYCGKPLEVYYRSSEPTESNGRPSAAAEQDLLILVAKAETNPPVPWEEFALSGVDWDEWPGGAAEIESAYRTQRERVNNLAMAVRRLVHRVKKTSPDDDVAKKAMDYLTRNHLQGSPLR